MPRRINAKRPCRKLFSFKTCSSSSTRALFRYTPPALIVLRASEIDLQYFSSRSFLAPISTSQVGIFNVTFEPGCRNNWHIHHAKSGGGQILVCVAGRGYYQEEGKDAVEMKPGDCINIPAEVKHWHGAAPDEWFSHLAIEVPGENSSNEWLEPVNDEEYRKLK